MRKEFDELVRRQLRLPFDKVGDIEAPTSRPFGPLQRGAYGVILADPLRIPTKPAACTD